VIQNAKITGTMLGPEDHGILSFMLSLSWDGGGIGYGGFALDEPKSGVNGFIGRFGTAFGMEAVRRVMEVVGVEKWEDLPGSYVRIESEGWGSRATRIGHITSEKWLDLKALAAEYAP
jgi:hypothetical protein